jgi:hypothetical protein
MRDCDDRYLPARGRDVCRSYACFLGAEHEGNEKKKRWKPLL